MKSVNLAMDNMSDLNEMSSKKPVSKYNEFWFENWSYRHDKARGKLILELKYSFDKKIHFTEVLSFPLTSSQFDSCNLETLERALQAFHIIGGISYYKAFLPSSMMGLSLTSDQATFWTKVYERGLGEFFYRNKIDFRGVVNFPVDDSAEPPSFATGAELSEKALVPIGGGKDSLVTAEILKEGGVDFDLISLRDAKPIAETAAVVDKPRIIIERQIDSELFRLNEEGAWNGHIPITAYISFLLIVASILYDKKFVCMSLEKSANVGQLMFHGMDVNHQYSKSEEFEKDFRNYVSTNVTDAVEFFSLLRGFDELKIAKIFSELKLFNNYSPVFTSCNTNFRIYEKKGDSLWCCNCPKCAFVFLILAPFVGREKMIEIFGENILDNADQESIFEELFGIKRFKPFECVGTVEESRVALWLISHKPEWKDDYIVEKFAPLFKSDWSKTNWPAETKSVLASSDQNLIPEKFTQLLKKYAD